VVHQDADHLDVVQRDLAPGVPCRAAAEIFQEGPIQDAEARQDVVGRVQRPGAFLVAHQDGCQSVAPDEMAVAGRWAVVRPPVSEERFQVLVAQRLVAPAVPLAEQSQQELLRLGAVAREKLDAPDEPARKLAASPLEARRPVW
jgi:hypothetical protein